MSININTLAANFDAGVSNYALHELKEISTALKPIKLAKHQKIFQPDQTVSVKFDYLAKQLNVLNGGRPSKILVDYVYQTINPNNESIIERKKKKRPQSKKAIKIFNRYRQLAENDALELGLTDADFEFYILAGTSAKSGDTVARLFNRNYQHTYESFKEQTEVFIGDRRSLFLYQASELLGAELRLFISLVSKVPDMFEIIVQIMQSLDDSTRLIFLQETVRQRRVHLTPFLKIAEDAIRGNYLDQLFTIMSGLNDEDLSYFLSAITKAPDANVLIHMMEFMNKLSGNEISQFLFLAQIPTKEDFYILFNAFETILDSNNRSKAFDTACGLPEKDTFNYMKSLAHSEKTRNLVMQGIDKMETPENKSHFLFLASWHPDHFEQVIKYLDGIKSKDRLKSFLNIGVNADHLLPDFLKIYSNLLSDELESFFIAAERNINSLFEFLSQVQEKKGYDRAKFLAEESKTN